MILQITLYYGKTFCVGFDVVKEFSWMGKNQLGAVKGSSVLADPLYLLLCRAAAMISYTEKTHRVRHIQISAVNGCLNLLGKLIDGTGVI